MGDTKSPPRLRSRQCMFVLYPESQQAAIDYCKHNLPCAWALHDKDVHSQASFDAYVKKHEGEAPDWMPGDLKKPHVHFVCSFANARYFSGIAKEIGVEVNVIRKVNNLYKAYVYLWHMLDPDKYQYSKDIVGTHDLKSRANMLVCPRWKMIKFRFCWTCLHSTPSTSYAAGPMSKGAGLHSKATMLCGVTSFLSVSGSGICRRA